MKKYSIIHSSKAHTKMHNNIFYRKITFTAVIILPWTLKICWNVHCVITNHRRDPYTTETTDNERFPICHGTNYFRFVLTFSFLFLHVSNCFSFLFVYSMCYKSEEYIQLWTIFGNKLQSRCAGPTRRFGVRIFKLFVTIEIVSYAWSQVTMKVSRYSFLISIASRLLQHVIPQISNA